MFFWGLIAGVFIGTFLGVALMCLLFYSRYRVERSDKCD
ncbi:MAG: DUF3789 domain-containing protein [Ruminococcus sp.]